MTTNTRAAMLHSPDRLDSDPSTEAMLAEHERLSDLFLYNTEMGEKRTSLYLTVISAGAAVLAGLAQFHATNTIILWSAVVFVAGMLVIGLVTFQRLIERRIRGMEYLRAINRIHRYFVDKDPALEHYYSWPPCDDTPFLGDRDSATTGLRDLIAILNSLFVAILIGIAGYTWQGGAYLVGFVVLAVGLGAGSWLLHEKYERVSLVRAEKRAMAHVRFPARTEQERS